MIIKDIIYMEDDTPLGIQQDGEIFELMPIEYEVSGELLEGNIEDLNLIFDCDVETVYGSTASYMDENDEEQFILLDEDDELVDMNDDVFFIEEESNNDGDIVGYKVIRS